MKKEKSKDYNYLFKVVIMGDGEVGKTTLVNKFVTGEFETEYISTIGANFYSTDIETCDRTVRLQLWDLAGQKRFSQVREGFYRGAEGAFFTFDLTRRDTFGHIGDWLNECKSVLGRTRYVLMGNKYDLNDEREIDKNSVLEATSRGFDYFETSAKTGQNVEAAFQRMAHLCLYTREPELFEDYQEIFEKEIEPKTSGPYFIS